MKIEIDVWVLIGVSLAFGIAACSSKGGLDENTRRMPSHWAVAPAESSRECGLIDGVYQNGGLIHSGKTTQPAPGRLDVALGQPLPSARLPQSVAVIVNRSSNKIDFQLTGLDTVSYSQSFICSGGWYVLQETQNDKYLSDGVNMDYSHHLVELAKSMDGGLIIHSVTNARFTTAGVFTSDERVEAWYRFQPVQ